MSQFRELPDWEKVYQDKPVETMPWFNPELDFDLERALTQMNLHEGVVLDLGTGPGTQAMALAERGFQVTGADISATAIQKAQARAKEKGLEIDWRQDDILNTHLETEFDWVFDRGCFHTFHLSQREEYIRAIARLVKPNGYLFLKCFSAKETRPEGPYRFTPEEIKTLFSPVFNLIFFEETVYQGCLNPLPLALFCVLQKSNES